MCYVMHCVGSYQFPLPNGSYVCDGQRGFFQGIIKTQMCQKKVITQTILTVQHCPLKRCV